MDRVFIPGSKWLYIKLYTGFYNSDRILIKTILPITNKLIKDQVIKKWFFIRYYDPDYHLRIRFLVDKFDYIGSLIRIIHTNIDPLVSSKVIWNVQIDTYNRELERYGENFIEESESIFYFDSVCIISILDYLKKQNIEEYRWMVSLKLIDSFLNDFLLDMASKYKIMYIMNLEFKKEFGFNEFNSKQFNHKFRDNKNTIEKVLNDQYIDSHFSALIRLIESKSSNIRKITNNIEKEYMSTSLMEKNVTSYIHMTLNRLFKNRNRIYELVIYDFMCRYYKSELAKMKIKLSDS